MLFDELARCRPWIEAALEHANGSHTFDDIAAGCYGGRFLLWARPNACAITEIQDAPRKRIVHVFLAGGALEEITDAIPDVAAYARNIGASEMTMTGRDGWSRALASRGWAKGQITMRIDL